LSHGNHGRFLGREGAPFKSLALFGYLYIGVAVLSLTLAMVFPWP
jgi:hypothetical protein